MSLTKKQLDIMDKLPNNEEDFEDSPLYDKCNFCPKCGSKKSRMTANMAQYPESWVKSYCSDCGFQLGLIDNSPYMGWYEYKYNDYVIDF